MTARSAQQLGRSHLITLLTTLGVIAVMAGGVIVGTNMAAVSGAATPTTLSLTTAAAGATCNNSNPAAPVCSGLASGEIINVSGTGFAPGALASIVECNSEPTQPVIFFLDNDVPVSCTLLSLVTIPSKGKTKGDLSGTKTLQTGITGPPVSGQPTTCNQVVPSTSVITGCSTTTNATTDAANYPCPPTPAQQAAGVTCVLAIGDANGDRAIGTILFGSETLPPPTTIGGPTTTGGGPTTTGGGPTTTGATTTTTGAASTTTTTSPTNTSTSTQVSATSVILASGAVTDSVTVQGTPTHGSPSGDVNFYVCQTGTTQIRTTGPCAATANDHLGTTHLTAGAGNSSAATSGAFTPTAPGTWCFSAVYGGGSVYSGSADNTSVANPDVHECVLVTPAPSTTGSFISSAGISLGPSGTVNDSVTVTGDVLGGSPTGGVSFYACHTSVASTLVPAPCPASGTPESADVALLPGAGDSASATSSNFVPTSVGTWCFSALYGGSLTYAESSDNTSASNLDSGECLLVTPPTGDAITSDPNVSATAGDAFSFLVTTSGSPAPTLKKKGRLPKGVHFVNNHNGTATLSGIPNLKKGVGVYHVNIVANFGKAKTKQTVVQALILTVA